MPKSITRTYSRYTRDAMILLGKLIRVARKERKMTMQALSQRAGISRGLLQRMEKGDLKCEVGVVFEVASIVGVPLFETKESSLGKHLNRVEEKETLLPQSIRQKKKAVDDDF